MKRTIFAAITLLLSITLQAQNICSITTASPQVATVSVAPPPSASSSVYNQGGIK